MKRSKIIRKIKSIIATRGPIQPTIKTAAQVLESLERHGMRLVDEDGVEMPYEPEEGWDAWINQQEQIETARDFIIVAGQSERTKQIAQAFLDGRTFEELAANYNVTRERIRQIVGKARRAYQRAKDGV